MSFQDMSVGTYGDITYGKTATMLITLEKIVGEQTMQRALHTYFMRYRFTHPTQEDFMKTVSEVAGQDLSWYWNQAVYGTQMLDYEVLRADSNPVNWWDQNLKEKKGETEYETQVILHRKGDFVFPVDAVGEVRQRRDVLSALGRKGSMDPLCVSQESAGRVGADRPGLPGDAGQRLPE